MSEELKPCPFCGSTDVECSQDDYCDYWSVTCIKCDCEGSPAYMSEFYKVNSPYENENEKVDHVKMKIIAIKKWNTRV